MGEVKGVLLDVDGVLVASWQPLPGAVDTVDRLRQDGIPFRLVTNTAQYSRSGLAGMLRAEGFDVKPGVRSSLWAMQKKDSTTRTSTRPSGC